MYHLCGGNPEKAKGISKERSFMHTKREKGDPENAAPQKRSVLCNTLSVETFIRTYYSCANK